MFPRRSPLLLALSIALVAPTAVAPSLAAAQETPSVCAAPSGPTEAPAIPGGSESVTGVQPGPLPAGTPVACWTGSSGNAVLGTRAVIVGDRVMTLTDTADAVAFAPDGTEAWRTNLATTGQGLLGGLATDGTSVFVGTTTGLVALAAPDGSTTWTYAIDPGPQVAAAGVYSPIVAGPTVIALVYTSDSRMSITRSLVAIDRATGEEVWSQPVFADIPAGAPSADATSVVLPEGDGSLVVRDVATGAEQLRIAVGDLGSPAATPVAITQDVLLMGLRDGTVTARARAGGMRLWTLTPGSGMVAAVTADGPMAFVNGVTTLYAVDAGTGQLAWQAPIQAAPPPFAYQPIPALVDGMVVLGTTDINAPGALLAFDAATGTPAWRVDLDLYGAIFSPVVAGERIYAPSFDLIGSGGLLAFGAPA